MNSSEDDFQEIAKMKEKWKEHLEEFVALNLKVDPERSVQDIKEEYFLEKMSTIHRGTVLLGREVRELQKKLDELGKDT
jgi:hypothetical protein